MEKENFFKGLKIYSAYIIIVISVFCYYQLNGMLFYNSSDTEHEGNNHSSKKSHGRRYGRSYYHK